MALRLAIHRLADYTSRMRYLRVAAITLLAIPCIAIWCGCGRDVRLAGKKIRHVQVAAVTHYGVTLDASATPEQVSFVALRAIREDILAKTQGERDAATDVQFDVCAADVIASRNRSSLPRDEYVYHVVTHWAPTVAQYAGDFEVESEKAIARFKNRGAGKSTSDDVAETELALEVADPSGDPAASVVMLVWLSKDGGLWRVTHFGFEPKRTLANAKMPASPTTGGS